jgi:hypothetical protein
MPAECTITRDGKALDIDESVHLTALHVLAGIVNRVFSFRLAAPPFPPLSATGCRESQRWGSLPVERFAQRYMQAIPNSPPCTVAPELAENIVDRRAWRKKDRAADTVPGSRCAGHRRSRSLPRAKQISATSSRLHDPPLASSSNQYRAVIALRN